MFDTSTEAPTPNTAARSPIERGLASNVLLQDDLVYSCFRCYLEESRRLYGFTPCLVQCGFESYTRYITRNFWKHHTEEHFKQDERYCCPDPSCTRKFKRTADLKRHLQIHCLLPGKYPCEVLGCKYGGKNGFRRRDKLLSHKRNVHNGKALPDQLMRKRKLLPKA